MSDTRLTIIISKKLQEDFKMASFIKKETMTQILLKHINEVVKDNRDSIEAMKKLK